MLLAPAIDELCSAMHTVAAPGMQDELGLTVATLAGITLVLPVALGLAIEPVALWMADGPWRRPLLVGSSSLWAASFVLAGLATSPWTLAFALALVGPASGVTLGVTQVALLHQSRDPERDLHRFTLAASAGDLAGPLLYAWLLALGGTWRHGFFLFGGLLALYALASTRVPLGPVVREADGEPRFTALREALRDRTLLLWLFAMALCTLLDEIMVLLSTLWVAARPGGTPEIASLGAACFLAGMFVGLSAVERRWWTPSLVQVCWVSLVGLALVLLAPTALLALPGLFLTGLGAGPQYPKTSARAYARRPDRPGLVTAMGDLFQPIDIAAPLLSGLCADRFGLAAALAVLVLQPLGILGVVFLARRGDPTTNGPPPDNQGAGPNV